jgi:hypothetical protein
MCDCGLFKENISIPDYITWFDRMMDAWDMEGSDHIQDIQRPGPDSNQAPIEYKSKALPTLP